LVERTGEDKNNVVFSVRKEEKRNNLKE